jgi:peptidyl-prolyl cis-trans isomerase SurA
MKKLILIIAIMLALAAAGAELVDRVVAIVGTEVILKSDVEIEVLQMKGAGLLSEDMTFEDVLDQLIENKLMLQKAKELNISVDEDKIRAYAENYLRQQKAKYPSEAAFNAELARMKTSQAELLQYYIDMLRDNARTEILIDRYVVSNVVVSESEMREFYEASKDTLAVKPVTWDTGIIYMSVRASDEVEQQKLAEIRAIKARLDNGEDFAELARTLSDCPSKARGGDLGFFGKGRMLKEFEDAAFQLDINEVSDIVRTSTGFHIIRLTEKRGEEVRASHILRIVQPTAADSLATLRQMEAIRSRIIAGEDFATLAAQYSEDESGTQSGGIIGEFMAEEMPELFRDQIFAAPVAYPTQVLQSEDAYYIFIRTLEHPARLYTFEEVQEELTQYLAHMKQMELYRDWMDELAKGTYVKKLP